MSWGKCASERNKRTLVAAIVCALVVAFGLCGAVPASAGDGGQVGKSSGSAQYLLGSGDAIRISVFGDDQLTVTAQIGPDGLVFVPLAGAIKVSGKTVEQARADIARALSAYIKNPDVTVTIVDYRKVRIVVVGEVIRPGMYEAPDGSGALTAIALSGGLTELADVDGIVAVDGGTHPVDYSGIVAGSAADVALSDGAVVHVPRAVRQILVLGDVARPGSYGAPRGGSMRLLDAVAAAGGVSGDARRAQVVWSGTRDGAQESFAVSFGALIDAPGSESNILLASGDVIFVSEAPEQASVIGEVARPGVYPISADTTLLDLLAMAGGPSVRADLGNVRVYAGGSPADGASFELADGDLAFAGDVKANPKVASGAVVVVPSSVLRVQVAGYVGRPGQVELERGATAVDAIVSAGGIREDGDGSKVVLTRRSDGASAVREIDIEGILGGQVAQTDAPSLSDGDVLFVPQAVQRLTVLGEVARPGVYPVERGATLMDVIAAAGGPTEKADMGAVRVYDGGNAAEAQTLELADDRLIFEGSIKSNPPARAGQVVVVPSMSIRVLATGHVMRPGSVELRRGATVLDVIAEAGGIRDGGDGTRVVLTRAGGEGFVEIDVEGILEGRPGAGPAPVICEGDGIYVPQVISQVSVLGEVARPGTYQVGADTTLLDLLAMAGGPSVRADLGNVRVYAGGSPADGASFELADGDLAFAGDVKANPKVASGAVVVVPSSVLRVQVAGYVGRPGQVELERGATAVDAIVSAGGIREDGDGSKVVLTRRSDGASAVREIDIEGILGGQVAQTDAPSLSDGDVLFVPQAVQRLTVLGEVARPGVYPVERGATLMDVIAAAGGPTEKADMGAVRVYDGGNAAEAQTLELADDRLIFEGSIKSNPPARAGQVVVVPSMSIRVLATGHVMRPGSVELRRGATVLDVIAEAGGIRDGGDGTRVVLTRAGGEGFVEIDVEGILEGRPGAGPAPVICEGDGIYVPQVISQVSVLGEVARPGVYPVGRGATLMDVIAAAGGPTQRADLSQVRMYEGGEAASGAILEVADDSLIYTGDICDNPKVAAGNVIVVPAGTIRVHVAGHVARPGSYELRRGAGVLEAIVAAGGIGVSADGARAVLVAQSDGEVRALQVDIDSILAGKEKGPVLLDGDSIFVPEASAQVVVLGEVARPGAYRLANGARLLDAIGAAGGPSTRASLEKVVIYSGEDFSFRSDVALGSGKTIDAKDNPVLGSSDVVVVGSRAITVSVAGGVARPGIYELAAGAKILDAISAAGGVASSGEERAVTHARALDGSAVSGIDLDSIGRDPMCEANSVLADGDVIYVPEAERRVAVLGAVARPGVYAVGDDPTLLEILAASGGPAQDADLTRVRVYSGIPGSFVDLSLADREPVYLGDVTANPAIDAGSVVVVPSRSIRVYVAGHVARPGLVELMQGSTGLDAIAAAGGVSAQGDGSCIALARKGAAMSEIDMEAVLAGEADDVLLAEGDALFVPEADPGQVVVLGEVARPGAYRLPRGAKLLDAIGAAGGATEKALLENVRIFSEGVSEGYCNISILEGNSIEPSHNPQVSSGDVIVVPSGAVKVSLIGAVARPGVYELPQGSRILDALSAAGGIGQQGDGTQVICSSASGPVDVMRLVAAPGAEANSLLSSGDVIYVPEARRQVAVLGEVARPGVYALPSEATLMDALAAAGGPSKHAALDGVRVYEGSDVRGGASLDVADEKLLYSGDVKANPKLGAGQIVVVPSGAIRVQVAGSVARPGEVELARGATIIEAVTASGGVRLDGDGAAVVVTRRGGGANVVDVDEAMAGGTEPMALLDGDVVYVPQRSGEIVVLGEVARPGGYSLPKGAKLLDAIAAAGGPTSKASLEDVTVYKGGVIVEGIGAPIGAGKALFSGKVTENPEVRPGDVVHVASRYITVSVFGRVARPGTMELPKGARALDAIGACGGILADGDHTRISLTRSGAEGPADVIDLEKALRDPGGSMALCDGDLLYVPQATRQVAIMGEILRPGVYSYVPDMTLMDVLAMAGGPTRMADLEGVRVYRGEDASDVLTLSVADDRLRFAGDIKSNPKVRPGDIVMIPSGAIRIQLAGHVARAGEVEVRKGATVLDAISAAGGIGASGDGTRVVVTRAGAEAREVNVDALLAGDGAEAPEVCEGDVIFVPEANRKVAVMGSVLRPGLYDFKPGMRLVDALAMAGGTTAAANLGKVMVYSGDEAASIALGGSPSSKGTLIDPTKGNNPQLQYGDIVIVPQAQTVNWSQISAMLTIVNQLMNIFTR
ncbi:MAG TPA: SLBB domain-containing protein [Bacillota bacterium]|nr:SLBB domain-containing protein [Bacillota bacterium]